MDGDNRFEGDDVVLPDDYEGAWLTKAELKARNKELEKVGKRICVKHQGHALPLTEEYFYYAKRDLCEFKNVCRACCQKLNTELRRKKYQSNAGFAKRVLEASKGYYMRNGAEVRRKCNERRRQRRRERFAQIMGRAS